MPMRSTRCAILSLGDPAIAIPATSPFTSAMKDGTPMREKPSAITSSEMVFPVPVAPAMFPWRLPYFASKVTGFSPLPMRISFTRGLRSSAPPPRTARCYANAIARAAMGRALSGIGPVVTVDRRGEEDVLDPRACSDVVDDQRTIVLQAVGDEPDVSGPRPEPPGHDVPRPIVGGARGDGQLRSMAREERREVGDAAMVDVRIGLREPPAAGIRGEGSEDV